MLPATLGDHDAARGFVSAVLGPGHPCAEAAVLLVSELFSNSLRHSESGAPGGSVTVTVTAGGGVVRVEVTDRSGLAAPELCPADDAAEGGRGLRLMAARWGVAAAWWTDSDLVRAGTT